MGEVHARQVRVTHTKHHTAHRPHRARRQLPPDSARQPASVHDFDTHRPLRTRVLGGVIEYRSAA
ncbi:hypothetical protein [Streptomyces hirsutus]|uniref:hypothetical protein n=1 Tax=Streptomyces hirsutus TaxID=35620 RepID=UPI003328D385